jgi:hypothetical protein
LGPALVISLLGRSPIRPDPDYDAVGFGNNLCGSGVIFNESAVNLRWPWSNAWLGSVLARVTLVDTEGRSRAGAWPGVKTQRSPPVDSALARRVWKEAYSTIPHLVITVTA